MTDFESQGSEGRQEMIKFVRITLPVNAIDPNDAVHQLQREYNLPAGFFDFSTMRGIKVEYLDADGNRDDEREVLS